MTDSVDELLRAQAALATVPQLLALGMSRSAIRTRLRRDWMFVLPRVVASSRRPLDDYQRLVAATLFADPDAVISSLTAPSGTASRRHGRTGRCGSRSRSRVVSWRRASSSSGARGGRTRERGHGRH